DQMIQPAQVPPAPHHLKQQALAVQQRHLQQRPGAELEQIEYQIDHRYLLSHPLDVQWFARMDARPKSLEARLTSSIESDYFAIQHHALRRHCADSPDD